MHHNGQLIDSQLPSASDRRDRLRSDFRVQARESVAVDSARCLVRVCSTDDRVCGKQGLGMGITKCSRNGNLTSQCLGRFVNEVA